MSLFCRNLVHVVTGVSSFLAQRYKYLGPFFNFSMKNITFAISYSLVGRAATSETFIVNEIF